MTPARPLISTGSPAEEGLSLGELLSILWGGRWLILPVTLLALALASYYCWRATPIYRMDAMLQIESKKAGKGNEALAAMTDGMFQVTTEAQAELEILRSNLVLGRAVESLQLDLVALPEFHRLLGSAWGRGRTDAPSLLVESFTLPGFLKGQVFHIQALGDEAFSLEAPDGTPLGSGRVGEDLRVTLQGHSLELRVRALAGRPGQRFRLLRRPLQQAIEDLRVRFQVAEKGKQTNILGLSLDDPSPTRGAETLNAILNHYIRQNIERKAEETSKTLAFLQEQLPLLRGKLDVTEDRLNQFRSRAGSVDLSEEAKLVLKQSVDLDAQLLGLRQKREELLRTYQERSDVVTTLNQQIAKLQGEGSRIERLVKGLPRVQQDVVRLTRDFEVNQALYTALLNNAQQLQMAKAGEIGNARIVDHATPSIEPISPRKVPILVIGTLLGILAGIGVVMLRQALRRGVDNPQAIEAHFNLPVLATVPHSRHQDSVQRQIRRGSRDIALVATTHPEDIAIESLRSLRTSLHFTLADAPNRAILIVGPTAGIGKSFVAGNFARVLAQGDSRVLLIDADMRRGHLGEYFHGLTADGGLSEILSGQLEWPKAVHTDQGLDIIATGTLPPNPAELLMGERFEALMAEVCQAYDYVIIDAPPVLAVTDAAIIGSKVGGVLLLLRAGRHSLQEIHVTLQRLESAGIRPKGFVFNDLGPSGSQYGYGYGYGYGHASYYHQRTPPSS